MKRTGRRLRHLAIFAMLFCAATGHADNPAPDLPDEIAATAVDLSTSEGIAALERSIGDARIVLLGEQWHGDGAAIAERARLVRLLHERMGFDVLVFEADFYALHRAWQQIRDTGYVADRMQDNLYAFWSSSRASAPLWKYIDSRLASARPIAIAGIDTKLTGGLSRTALPKELAERLAGLDGVERDHAKRAADTLAVLLQPLDALPNRPSEADIGLLVELVDRLAAAEPLTSSAEDLFWRQLAQSLRSNVNGEYRDPGMASNLVWLATQLYPDRKLIVWAHNNHILLDKWALYDGDGPAVAALRSSEPPDTLGKRTYVGESIRHYFGGKAVYALATLSHHGRFSADIAPALLAQPADLSLTKPLVPAPPGTLEDAVHRAGHSTAFVDLQPFRNRDATVASRVLDYSQLPPLWMRLWDGYDGVLYLDRTYGLDESSP